MTLSCLPCFHFGGREMNNEKVVAFQKQKIIKLKSDVRRLEQEIILLEKENETLRNIDEIRKYNSEDLNNDLQKIKEEYQLGLSEIHELKKKYEDAILNANKARKEYADKMEILLKKLNKYTR